MNIYTISCYSKCGSFFAAYLQEVTVKANSEDEAKTVVKEWLKKEGKNFEYPENQWDICCIDHNSEKPSVIDYKEESDY